MRLRFRSILRVMAYLTACIITAAVSVTANAAGFEICYDGGTHWYDGSVFDLYVNGEQIFSPMEPIIFNDRALVPIREIFEKCGADVRYTGENQCVEIQYGKKYIRMYINNNQATVNGKKMLIPDGIVPKLIYKPGGETKTMVPVRFISEAAGMKIDFDGALGKISITAQVPTPPTAEPTPDPTAEPAPVITDAPVITQIPSAPTAAPIKNPSVNPGEPSPNLSIIPDNIKTTSSSGEKALMLGIDVSEHNGVIDWELIKDQIDFAILRCGYGSDITSQDDKQWKRNADECTRLGIPFGVYLYSYANTEEKAASEAQHVLRLIKGYKLSLPVFYDLEDSIQLKLKAETLGRYAQIFCDTIQSSGYEVGIYSGTYWWNNVLTDGAFDNPSWYKWVAQYNTSCTYQGKYVIWQYSDSGSMGNIENHLDMNILYSSTLIKN